MGVPVDVPVLFASSNQCNVLILCISYAKTGKRQEIT